MYKQDLTLYNVKGLVYRKTQSINQIEMITWNHIIINIRKKYFKSCNHLCDRGIPNII